MHRDEPMPRPPSLDNAKLTNDNSKYINTVKFHVIWIYT